ncbi:MAG TPA: SPFH domain-containing protein [Polyangiaceae bacterium]|nr:SPFH domain-containing protein [Polyangiaceae bacterium]
MGLVLGVLGWLVLRYGVSGFFMVEPNERAVLCSFGRAERVGNLTTLQDPVAQALNADERERYVYPQVKVVPPGFHWRLPWQTVHRASLATATVSIAFDPEDPKANAMGQVLEAVTKDQLNTGLRGQLRYTVSERNLYAYLFGVRKPVAHVMGYFISILRNRIANFEAPRAAGAEAVVDPIGGAQGISINDLRKNLRDLNEHMNADCAPAAARYGISLDAALITSIDPPNEVDSALAAINTAHNHVSSEISLAQAAADQRIVQSKRAVEIETLNAQAEVQPLLALAEQLRELAGIGGPAAVDAYVRNAKLPLHRHVRSLLVRSHGQEGSQ